MLEITCPNCQKTLDLSFIIGQKKIEKNPTTCHICNRPYDKVRNEVADLPSANKPKRKRNRNPNPQSNESLPKKTMEEILLLKKKKEIILSGETKVCKKCEQDKPVERYITYLKKSGNPYTNIVCMDCMNAYGRESYAKNKEKHKLRCQKRYLSKEGREAMAKRTRQTMDENPEYYKALRAFHAQKPEKKLARRIRNRLAKFLKAQSTKTSAFIGCSGQELRQHFESKFQRGMSWENYGYGVGKWVIDHIKPISLFNIKEREERYSANHYSNLQPLWYVQNDAKSDNYDPDHPMGWHGLNSLISDEDKALLSERLGYKF